MFWPPVAEEPRTGAHCGMFDSTGDIFDVPVRRWPRFGHMLHDMWFLRIMGLCRNQRHLRPILAGFGIARDTSYLYPFPHYASSLTIEIYFRGAFLAANAAPFAPEQIGLKISPRRSARCILPDSKSRTAALNAFAEVVSRPL